MAPLVSTLHPPAAQRPAALALRLNAEVLLQLRALRRSNVAPKLVVKDGKFLVKISDTLLFPCLASPETLRLDVYSPRPARPHDLSFTGTVTSRLNVLSDPKQIKEHRRLRALAGAPDLAPPPADSAPKNAPCARPRQQHQQQQSPPPSSIELKAYVFAAADTSAERTLKFISLLALGPMTRQFVQERLGLARFLKPLDVDHLFAAHTQPYWRKDTFTENDVYPLEALGLGADAALQKLYVILKDKAYKELRPWQWHAYTDHERKLIIDNCNHALSRQGFLDTHPLRLRIVEQASPARVVKKSTALGGGLIVSSSKKPPPPSSQNPGAPAPGSPVPNSNSVRASTESPRLNSEARKRVAEKGRKGVSSSLRAEDACHTHLQGATLSLSLSSDEEKRSKRLGTQSKRLSNSSAQSSGRGVNSAASGTPLSSINDEQHLDPSDPDTKPGFPKSVLSLPARPSSSFTNSEKKKQYYSQLADKFRLRYKEYEQLHRQLSKDTRKNSHAEKKKSIMKLYELHNSLSEWKRRLWDYHNENNMAESVMNLAKHRKLNSASRISALAPLTLKVASTERFTTVVGSLGAAHASTTRKLAFHERPSVLRAKIALDY